MSRGLKINWQYSWLPYERNVSMRVLNILNNLKVDIEDKEAVIKLIQDGTLAPGKYRNYGEQTHKYLCHHLGLYQKGG